MNIITSAYRFVRYGRQIGKVHTNGSRLYSGSYIRKSGGTKTLVSHKGDVLRTISKRKTGPYCFEVEDVEKIPHSNKALVRSSIYSNQEPLRFIVQDVFIGEKYPNGWALAGGNGANFISSNNYHLKPSPLNPLFKA